MSVTTSAPAFPDSDTRHAKGLILSVLRGDTDCTAGGITSRHNQLTLVGTIDTRNLRSVTPRTPLLVSPMEYQSQVFAAQEDRPAVALLIRYIGGPVPALVPVEWDTANQVWRDTGDSPMAGGNYAAIIDSRVSDMLRGLLGHGFYGALAVHDRIEH